MTGAELTSSLREVLAAWPSTWPGIPRIFESCITRLGGLHARSTAHRRLRGLQVCAGQLVPLAEKLGRDMAAVGREPAYHSRLHTGLALVSLTALISSQRRVMRAGPVAVTETEYLLMLAMLSHDIGHRGGRNEFAEEIERKTVEIIQPALTLSRVGRTDQARIKRLILRTDPRYVPRTHAIAQQRPFNLNHSVWQCVLIQEADVLASALPEIGEFLTGLLAEEWAGFDAELAKKLTSRAGRIGFLRNGALFSSPASRYLGLSNLVTAQLRVL